MPLSTTRTPRASAPGPTFRSGRLGGPNSSTTLTRVGLPTSLFSRVKSATRRPGGSAAEGATIAAGTRPPAV